MTEKGSVVCGGSFLWLGRDLKAGKPRDYPGESLQKKTALTRRCAVVYFMNWSDQGGEKIGKREKNHVAALMKADKS